jgi:hypothetical protein
VGALIFCVGDRFGSRVDGAMANLAAEVS